MIEVKIRATNCIKTNLRGFDCYLIIVCNNKKEASYLLGCSVYTINNHAYLYPPKTKECIENINKVFCFFDSGEMAHANINLYKELIPLTDAQSFIENYRETYKTYQDTINNHDK